MDTRTLNDLQSQLNDLKAKAANLPFGIAARIEAADLERLLDEREELLAALEELREIAEHERACVFRDGYDCDCCLGRARAAIAKAVAP